MSLLPHSLHWIKGELLEAQLMLLFAGVAMTSSLIFWKIGATPAAKAIILPLLCVSLIISASSLTMIISNKKRLDNFPQVYQVNSGIFATKEKRRVEKFIPIYEWHEVKR